ncbi:hypothetical protein [Falsiroseomonas bella]|nr:hypothetical protein [Falsiroseomonas bella]
MGTGLTTSMIPAAWLATGGLLGITATLLLRRLRSWREARALAEWDPY